jgi:hypothetical protein
MKTMVKHEKKLLTFLELVLILIFTGIISCDDKENSSEGKVYDPSKPVIRATFYPDSGKFQERVLLTGENFGVDPSIIRVYFNAKQAPVIGSTGNRMYVMAPRLPGENCIISLVVGSDSSVFESVFKYRSSVTVTTIAGNGNLNDYQDGDLFASILQPRYILVGNEVNVYVIKFNMAKYE